MQHIRDADSEPSTEPRLLKEAPAGVTTVTSNGAAFKGGERAAADGPVAQAVA